MHTLVTGAAGFIGFHLSARLLDLGHTVIGIDNLNDYYDVKLKKDRLALLQGRPGFRFELLDMADHTALDKLFAAEGFTHVASLAAQAGVRYSLENPRSYLNSNLLGFGNILEACRINKVEHLVYASSSSVYGLNGKLPFSVENNVDHPVSLYGASKKANELMAHSYSHIYGLPCTGLRFFTVYGPWGRPDMALHRFTTAILRGHPIDVYNNGHMRRDFTYIDDIVEGVVRAMERPAASNPSWNAEKPDPSSSSAPWSVYNIGNHSAVELSEFISILETILGIRAQKHLLPMQPGDVEATYADVSSLSRDTGFAPNTPLETGIRKFVEWYREYYKI